VPAGGNKGTPPGPVSDEALSGGAKGDAEHRCCRPGRRIAENGPPALVIYHTCETSLPHLKLQTDIPVSAVNVGEGADLAGIRQAIGRKKCLTGNFDPKLLRDGTPEQVAETTAEMVNANAAEPGYVFNTGEGIMATTPRANVEAMIRAARGTPACQP